MYDAHELPKHKFKFRKKMLEDIIALYRERSCCNRVVIERGDVFRKISYEELKAEYLKMFPDAKIPEDC